MVNVTVSRTYDPGKRLFKLLANLVDRPRLRSELYELGYDQSGADRAKALSRDIDKLREAGYPISISDSEDPLYQLDRGGLIAIDLDAADLTLLRLAAESLPQDKLHKVASRTVQKLLGGARITDDQASVRISIPELGPLFDIVEALGERAPLVIEYDNPRAPDRKFYTVEVSGVWETLGSFYARGIRTAVGPTRDEMTETPREVRNFRLSRIRSLDVLEPTGYDTEAELSRIFDPVTLSIFFAPGAGENLRIRGEYVGEDEKGWSEYRYENVNWPRMLDHLSILGDQVRTDYDDYRQRLDHLARLGE